MPSPLSTTEPHQPSTPPPHLPPHTLENRYQVKEDEEDIPFLVKKRIAVIGARGVGKSALVIRCSQNIFERDYKLTFHDTYRWKPVVNGIHYDVSIDDTDGQDENSEFGMRYTTGVDGYILMFSIRDESSFEVVKGVNEKLLDTLMIMERKGVKELPRVLVGNQLDLDHERQVPTRNALKFAKEQGIPYLETSAFTPYNVEAAFELVLKIIQQNLHESHTSPIVPDPKTTSPPQPPEPTHHSCVVQ